MNFVVICDKATCTSDARGEVRVEIESAIVLKEIELRRWDNEERQYADILLAHVPNKIIIQAKGAKELLQAMDFEEIATFFHEH